MLLHDELVLFITNSWLLITLLIYIEDGRLYLFFQLGFRMLFYFLGQKKGYMSKPVVFFVVSCSYLFVYGSQ